MPTAFPTRVLEETHPPATRRIRTLPSSRTPEIGPYLGEVTRFDQHSSSGVVEMVGAVLVDTMNLAVVIDVKFYGFLVRRKNSHGFLS